MRAFRVCSLFVLTSTVALATAGCRDDTPGNNNNQNQNHNATGDNTIYQVQDPQDPNALQKGDQVTLEDVVVTAVDNYGDRTGNIWVEEPDGGPFSGVQVYAPAVVNGSLADISVGDLVTVRGEIDEYAYSTDTSGRTVTEIINGSVERLGASTAPAPEVVAAHDVMNDPEAERWEGVLVTVQNVRASNEDTTHEEATFTGGLVAGSDLYDVLGDVEVGTCYSAVTGVSNYFFDYFILPRSGADLVVAANDGDCDNSATEMDCSDGLDNDGDGDIDCADSDCHGIPGCVETACGDGLDNDGDGYTDCDDHDCLGTVDCPVPVENTDALCSDLQDNDGDNLVDCEDPSCYAHPNVTVCAETSCTNGVDDDGDGFIDCADRECWTDAACVESDCSDSSDNDGDGYTDCDDRDCWGDAACAAVQETGQAECTNGVDDDGDGYADCDDWSCQDTYPGCVETDCADGLDNDGDGHTDCEDFDCQFVDPSCGAQYEADPISCADGLDNDGDGHIDCADFSCRCCNDGCTGFEHVADTCSPCG